MLSQCKRRCWLFLAILPVAMGLTACASWLQPSVQAGQTEAEVVARLGNPTNRYRDGQDTLLEYRTAPLGQTTHMARLNKEGRLVSYEQVLTLEHFGAIQVGQAGKEEVLRQVGAPSETRFFPLTGLEAWDYPFKESGVWDSLMSVYFDRTGVVRRIENGLDPRRMARD